MDAVIFAGESEFERCPLSLSRPKALWPLGGGTVLDHQLRRLAAQGFRRVVVAAGRVADQIRWHLSARPADGMTVLVIEDPLPRGPAGCLLDASIHLGTGPAAALEIGALTAVNWRSLFARHEAGGAPLSVGMTHDAHGRPQPAGLYVWDSSLLRHIPARGFQDIKERLLPALAAVGRAAVPLTLHSPRRKLDTPQEYLAALAAGDAETEPAGSDAAPVEEIIVELKGTASTPAGAQRVEPVSARAIPPGVTTSGKVVIEPGAQVAEDVVLAGPVLICEGAIVEAGAIIRNSAVWPDARVGAGAHLDECILAAGASAPALSRRRLTVMLADTPGPGGRHALKFRGYKVGG